MSNSFTVIGNLTADPELKYFEGGNHVANVRIADNIYTKDGEKANFYSVSLFGNGTNSPAERLAAVAKKGSLLKIDGELQPLEKYTDKNGQEQTALRVKAYNWTFVGAKKSDSDTVGEFAVAGSAPSKKAPWE